MLGAFFFFSWTVFEGETLSVFTSRFFSEIFSHFVRSSTRRYFSQSLLAKILGCELQFRVRWRLDLPFKGEMLSVFVSCFSLRPSPVFRKVRPEVFFHGGLSAE